MAIPVRRSDVIESGKHGGDSGREWYRNYFNGFSRKFLFCNTYIQNNLIYIFFILKNKNIKYVIVVLTYLQVI